MGTNQQVQSEFSKYTDLSIIYTQNSFLHTINQLIMGGAFLKSLVRYNFMKIPPKNNKQVKLVPSVRKKSVSKSNPDTDPAAHDTWHFVNNVRCQTCLRHLQLRGVLNPLNLTFAFSTDLNAVVAMVEMLLSAQDLTKLGR